MTRRFSELCGPLMEWVYDHADAGLGSVNIAPFGEQHGLDLQESFALLRYAKERGLLDDKHRSMGNPEVNLTPEGTQWVEERRRRRVDPLLRAAAARTGLLVWLWKRQQEGVPLSSVDGFLEVEESAFEGEHLTVDEIDRAAAFLAAKELITGATVAERKGPVHAQTTTKGDECIERYGGNVSEYEQGQAQSGAVINIYGNQTGNIAANSRDVQMHSTTTVDGVDVAAFVLFARAVRQAVPVLGLPEEDAEEIVQTVNRMEQEASAENPDVTRLQRWRRNTTEMLNSPTVSGALGGILAAYAQLGLPGV